MISQITQVIYPSLSYILYTSFIWLPLLLFFIFWKLWLEYIRAKFIYKLEWVLLEIKIPQEITKSPLAMETFLMSLYQTGGEGTFIDRYWKGQSRATFSLEIVSIEGVVKFYIYTQKKFRSLIESGLYAQYQNIEIHEAVDYTRSVYLDLKEMDLFVTDYALTQPDPFPIKTYIDYGLDKESVEDEYKIDPINTIIEFMGSIGANQQAWLQLVIRAHKKEYPKAGTLLEKTDKWKDEAKAEIDKIRKGTIPKDEKDAKFPNPTKGEQERMLALERSVSKIPFDVGIRAIYVGKKDVFNSAISGSVRGLLKAYDAPHLNSFKPDGWLGGFDYPWQDFRDIRKNKKKKKGLEAYKRRCFFDLPFKDGAKMVLNVEELASIFHLPGRVTTTPNLNRIPSKKSQAPSNLPI